MTMAAKSPVRAVGEGLIAVIGSPLVVIAVAITTMVIAIPFAAVIGSRVQASLASQPPVALDETEIDPEWWQEFRAQARGLEATFTPAIVGFAAPLDSISAVLDGRQPPLALVAPVTLSILTWAFLWGGVLSRYHAGHGLGVRAFIAAALQHLPRFVAIAIISAAAIVALYLTLHVVLFGPIHQMLVSRTSTERGEFVVRVLLYIVFWAPVALVGLAADYARAASVTGVAGSLAQSWRAGVTFVRANTRAVITVYLLIGAVFVAVTIAYGTLEIYGGSEVGGWRAIVIGQVYIVVRLILRLTSAAAGLRLFAARATP